MLTVPSGWTGQHQSHEAGRSIRPDEPHGGKTCLKIEYREKEGWGGIVWQSPAGDWGDRPGGWDLPAPKKLSFCCGATGGEEVSFQYGLIADNKPFFDTGKGKLDKVKLSKDWKQYTIALDGENLARIKTGFCCVCAATGNPITFYLDDIRFE